MLGNSPLSTQPLSTLEASSASANVVFREPLAFPASPKRQIGYAHVACNLLVTTLAIAAAAVPFVQQLVGSSPTPNKQVVAQQIINPLLLGISSGATTPFVQQLSAGAPGSKVQVFIPEAPPRLIGKTLPDYGPVGDGVSDSSPRIAKPVQVDIYPRLIGKTLPDYSASGSRLDVSAPSTRQIGDIESLPNLNLTTLASPLVDPGSIRQPYFSGPQSKRQTVVVEQILNTLPLNTTVASAPFKPAQDVSTPQAKFSRTIDVSRKLIALTLPDYMPLGRQAFDGVAAQRYRVHTDAYQNLLESTLAVIAGPLPIGSRVSESAPPPKYNVGAPLFPERIEAPSEVTPDALPIGQRVDTSSPPRKAQVRVDAFPDNVLLGIAPPVVDEAPASAFFGGNAEIPRNPQVDAYPNLLGTTLAVQVQAIPVGRQWFESIPAPKYAVTAYNAQSLLTTGIPIPPIPVGVQLSDTAPQAKYSVQVDKVRTDLVVGIAVTPPPLPPLGLPVDVSQWQGKFAVYDLNLLWSNSQIPNEIPPPVVVPDEIRHRGGGYKKHRKAHVEPRLPSQYKRLEEMVDEVSAEMAFKEIEATASADVKQQAKSILRPFTPSKSLVKADTVDWEAVEADATKIGALLALWAAERRRLELADDDEEWMMWE